MKKIFLIVALASFASGTAFAESVVDYKQDRVTISGESEGRVGITLFFPDMWYDDIEEGVLLYDVVSHNEQTTSDEDGKYTFSFKQKDKTGLYRYSVDSDSEDSENGAFVYVSKDDRNKIVLALNEASESEIPEVCEMYKFELETGDSLFEKADEKTSAKIISGYIEENPFDEEDFRKVCDTVKTAYQIGAIASGKITNLSEIEDVYSVVDERIYEWMSSEKITESRKKAIISDLKGDYDTFEEFSDEFIEKLVLNVVEQPNGIRNLKAIISDFAEEIDVDVYDLKNSDYDEISGEAFGSLSELESALSKSESSGTQSGGGGGGSSKPSNKNNAPSVSIGAVGTQNINTPVTYIMKFEDIDSVPWAYESIASLAKDGIVSGKTEAVFDPMGNVTREEFVKMLVGVLGKDVVSYKGSYNDVKYGAWYADFVETATKNNLCHGIGDNNFGVGMPITRQDMCVMIYNAIKGDATLAGVENVFADGEKIAGYAKEAVLSLAKLDLVHGTDNKEFLPQNNTTRAEAAVLLNSLKNYLKGGNN